MKRSAITWLAPLALVFTTACGDSPMGSQLSEDGSQDVVAISAAHGDNDRNGSERIDILDDCDSTDPAWNATGGCALRGGSVTAAEFGMLLGSPLSASVVGHPAWTNDPTYLEVRLGKSVRVTNRGGRFHTLTPVAQFGGGRVGQLNIGLTPAPECALAQGAVDPFGVAPGAHITLNSAETGAALKPGINRLMCCIHPWMRELVRVTPREDHGHGDRD